MQLFALPYDRWEGYASERQRIVEALRGVKNVVVLTTDTHANLVGDVRLQTFTPTGPVASGITEVITGPVATNTFAKEIDDVLGRDGIGNAHRRGVLQAAAARRGLASAASRSTRTATPR